MIGALASGLDISIGTFFAVVVHWPTRWCTAIGLVFGTTINFFAQRRFAFPDRDTRLGATMTRWAIVTTLQILVHGQLVTMLRDQLHVPYIPAKMFGDVCVFTILQLVLLRHVVFPQRAEQNGAR